jgi:hypothetical protein
MFGLIVVGILALPFIAGALRRTPIWWLPSALLGATALLVFAQYEGHGSGGTEGVMTGIGNAIAVFGGLSLCLLALIAYRVGAGGTPELQPDLAPAIVVDR